jgi:hypothetical protein
VLTASALVILSAYVFVFLLVGTVVMLRVSQWGIDTADADVGSILPREPLEVSS